MTTKPRFDGYIRVSQTNGREGESFRSPPQQREIIERWAADNGTQIAAWHTDLDQSGSRMDRPELNRALERIRGGQTAGVVVAFLDRFSRAKVSEAMEVWEEVNAHGGSVVATDLPGLDPKDKMGEYALTNMLAMKRMEWRTAAERWEMSRGDAIKAGKSIGGAPFGYRFRDPTSRVQGKGVVDSRLVVDEAEAKLVRELFERKAAGATWLELARWLDAQAPKPDGRQWSRNTVRSMIGRRTYLGEVHHGKLVRAGAHEAIVDAALWRRAQNPPGRRTPRGTYLLTGLVRCAGCGRRMRATSGGRGSKSATYGCVTPECSLRYTTVTVERLDAEVVEQFFAHLDAFHLRAVDDGELDAARVEAEERRGAVERLAAVVPSHPAAVGAHQAALEEAELALSEAEDRLAQLLAAAAHGGPDVRELRSDWPTLTLDEQREILRAGVDAVLVRRSASRARKPPVAERIRVLFRGEAPAGLVDNGRSGAVAAWTWNHKPGTSVAAG